MMLDFHALNAEATRRLAAQHVGPVKHQDLPSLSAKDQERAALEAQVNAFLERGGQITKGESGMPSFPWTGTDQQARLRLVSVTRFSRQNDMPLTIIHGAIKAGTLRAYMWQSELHIVASQGKAFSLRHSRKMRGEAA